MPNKGNKIIQATTYADTIRQAMLEKALRERQKRQRTSVPDFGEWLPQVTPEYNWNWTYLKYIQRYVDRVTKREIDRLMIFMPPRHGKSEQITVRYPAYELERDPTERVVVAAHTASLAERFSRKTRAIVRARGRVELDPERSAVKEWLTTAGGGVRAVGIGGAIAGLGFKLLLLDDLVKSREEVNSKAFRERTWEWFTDDLWTRREPGSAVILQMTRWHEDDIAGRILASEDATNWVVIKLPALLRGTPDPPDYPEKREYNQALNPDRFDADTLLSYERIMGGSFSALYQQEPTPEEGEIFKKAWFNEGGKEDGKLRTVTHFPQGLKRTQVWDTALETGERNDFSSMVEGVRDPVTGNIYVSAMVNERLDFPALAKRMKLEYERLGSADLCVEDKASGKPARQQLKTQGIPVIEIPAGTRDKEVRAKSITQHVESGLVIFVMQPGNINDQLLRQLITFPNAAHDDLVDAFVHLMRRLTASARAWSKDDIKRMMASMVEPESMSDSERAEAVEREEMQASQLWNLGG